MKKYIVIFTISFAFLNSNAENNFEKTIHESNQVRNFQVAKRQGIDNFEGKIPIMAYSGIPALETSVARYQEMRDANINYSYNSFPSLKEVIRALDAAEQAGVKLIISCPELKNEPEKTVKQLMEYPALAGYHLRDEPPIQLYPELSDWAKRIQSVDKKHFCYVNLFPDIASPEQLGTESYEEYVQEYLNQIPVQFASFDYYPVFKERLGKSWYENLELFSRLSSAAGKPFWAFVLTSSYIDDQPSPQTLAAMRLQAFSNLAYGAQGIQYYTYWSATSVNSPTYLDLKGAPISAVTGKRSVVYDRVKQIGQEIQNLSKVFLGAKVISVRHTGMQIPSGTIRLTSLPEPVKVLDTQGNALVSVLQKDDFFFFAIINKDFLNNMKFTIYGDESLQRVLKDGTVVPASSYESSMELDPGDIAIYMFPAEKNQK